MTTARNTRRTAKKAAWRAAFLAELAASGNVSASATAADVSRRFVYEQRAADLDFAAAWDDALEQGADSMEAEARRRAVDGWEEPVWYQGEDVGTVRKFSDTLLIFLLKGARPEKYRDRTDVRQTSASVQIDWEQVPPPIRDAFIEGRISLHDVLSQLRTAGT